MNTLKNYHIKILLFLIIILLMGILAFVFYQEKSSFQMDNLEQLALIGNKPIIIAGGNLFKYENETWTNLGIEGTYQLIVSGENLCALSSEGQIYYDGNRIIDDSLPLTSQYNSYMANLALKKNEKMPFTYINQNLDYLGFCAILDNGHLLYQGADEYLEYSINEDAPMFISGSYILSEKGNIYILEYGEVDESTGEAPVNIKKIYDQGDIISISADVTSNRCIGITNIGNVISWGGNEPLDISQWEEIKSVSQGFNYAIGLREDGKVLYVDGDKANSAIINQRLEKWTNISLIATYNDSICAVKSDGTYVSIMLTN